VQIQPDDTRRCKSEFKYALDQLGADCRHGSDFVNRMAAFRHVRDKSAGQVAIRQSGNLAEKVRSHTGLQFAPETQEPSRHGKFQKKQYTQKPQEHRDSRVPLVGKSQNAREVQKRAVKEGFNQHTARRHRKSAEDSCGRKESVGSHEVD
jgi:hypothetical protein